MIVLHINTLFLYKRFFLIVVGVVVLAIGGLATLTIVAPNNILVKRIVNISTGEDSSAKGRTSDSFILGWRVANTRNVWFGIGLGHVKIAGKNMIMRYYEYVGLPPSFNVTIPNSLGELLATYGLLGVFLKLLAEIWLFFRCRVFNNYYCLALFIFVFIYQFTGSFVLNIAELALWIMAFSPAAFPLFAKQNYQLITTKT